MRPIRPTWVIVAALGCACTRGATTPAPVGPPDAPVPASEPRATLDLIVDLHPSSTCEEDFDLQLYADRSIELVEWDDAVGQCQRRSIRVRFLTNRTSQQAVLESIRGLAAGVEEKK